MSNLYNLWINTSDWRFCLVQWAQFQSELSINLFLASKLEQKESGRLMYYHLREVGNFKRTPLIGASTQAELHMSRLDQEDMILVSLIIFRRGWIEGKLTILHKRKLRWLCANYWMLILTVFSDITKPTHREYAAYLDEDRDFGFVAG